MSKTYVYRVENIPAGTTRQALLNLFDESDRGAIEVHSLAPTADRSGDLVATITFKSEEDSLPTLLDEDIILDRDFVGLTPLNDAEEPVTAEYVHQISHSSFTSLLIL